MSAHLSPEQLEGLVKGGGDPHLEGCAECAGALRRAKASRALLGGLKPYTMSEAGFGRVEAKLMEAVAKPVRPFWLWPALGMATALVVVATVYFASPREVPVAPVAVKPVAPALQFAAWPVLTAVRVEGAKAPLAGQPLAADEVVDVGLAHLQGEGLYVALAGRARFGQRAELEQGTLFVDAAGESLREGHTGEIYFASSGAAYAVTSPSEIQVFRGTLLVGHKADLSDATSVRAPARYLEGQVLPLEQAQPPHGPVGTVALSIAGLGEWSSMDLDGQRLTLPFSGLLGDGPHLLTVRRGEQARTMKIDLKSALNWTPPPLEDRVSPPPSEDELAAIQRALAAQRPRLAECYEKWLKANAQAEGQASLELTISTRGVVTAAAVDAPDLPADARACLARTAKKLVMPKLAATQSVELPLVLRARGH